MARAKLYLTVAQKKEAARAKTERYYCRHREHILESMATKRRQKRVKQQKKKDKEARKQSQQSLQQRTRSLTPDIRPTEYWLHRAGLIPNKILKALNGNPKTFTRYVCDRICRAQRNRKPFSVEAQLIEEALGRLNQLQRLARQYSSAMLQLTGVNDDFRIVERHSNSVDQAIKWVEDISMGILGEEDFIEWRRQGKFLFQKGDFVF
ncbi:hypothetical protein C8J56DRAFT_1067631 [Mycena floridula]|nr:hypothetical protein C8J56DRAFT_1067631 [Mycena floridula]